MRCGRVPPVLPIAGVVIDMLVAHFRFLPSMILPVARYVGLASSGAGCFERA